MTRARGFFERAQAAFARLHANPVFEWATIAIILVSSLTIGVKSYELSPLARRWLWGLDAFITLYFLTEIIVRIGAAGGFRVFFRGGWNRFDFIIVVGSLIPVDESEYALLARLLRLFRVMRLIYFVPQLRVLVGALIKAIPRIGYVGLMMFIIFYVYAAVGNLLFAPINGELWGDVGIAMLTLFRVATLEDWTDVMYETMKVHPLSWTYYLSFIFLSAFVFLNMMIGVIIDSLNEEHRGGDDAAAGKGAGEAADAAALAARLRAIEARLAEIEKNTRPPPRD